MPVDAKVMEQAVTLTAAAMSAGAGAPGQAEAWGGVLQAMASKIYEIQFGEPPE